MKQNQIIKIFFILIFTLSTSGLPLSLHYCKMMNNASFDSCSVCTDKPEPTNCCSIISKEIKFSDQQKSVCCTTLLVAEPIEDNFVQSKIEIAKIHNELYFSNINIDSNNYFTKTFSIRISSHSPPIASEDLYTLNSTFLI